MNTTEIVHNIIANIKNAWSESFLLKEAFINSGTRTSKHEFLFFIKPEITLNHSDIQLEKILNMLFGKLEQFGLQIKDIRILGAAYLEKFNIIERHYGVINAMSRTPADLLSMEATEKFINSYGKSPDEVYLLGSLQFLRMYPDFTPVSLDELWQKSETVKLAGGTYCARVKVQQEMVYLINGFHPRQLIHFTEKGRSIVAFTLTGDLDWSSARNNFIGKTNPAEALTGSLRNELLVNRQSYGLNSVSSSLNGFHLSAGPVEGLVELIRYCSDYASGTLKTADDFIFGKQLKAVFQEPEITRILDNEFVLFKGKKISIFDLTEEKNGLDALELLKGVVFGIPNSL